MLSFFRKRAPDVNHIESVRTLRAIWQRDEVLQAAINAAFDTIGFDSDYVSNCIAAARTGTSQRKTKYIKDNIWGMVEIDGVTVRLLDCPIVQRLRGIKQLGFSYLTYPTAEHSRFAHSLGMTCVVNRLLDSIGKRAASPEEAEDKYVLIEELRPLSRSDIAHAAILHDVGHMPFSHATENVLVGHKDLFSCADKSVADFIKTVARQLSKSLLFSEILSLVVILSKRFSEFYDHYVKSGSEDTDALLRIACLIAGLPPEPRLSGAAELISASVVDADKIDYVNRDAYACGIPVGVDVSRIFLRSGFLRASRDQLLKSKLKDDPAPEEILFVVNASGFDTIDEITQARAALYQRVYLHAVTRTAEAVYARALEDNVASKNRTAELTNALGLWAMSDNGLLDMLVNCEEPKTRLRSRSLRNRQLPKKACVFSSTIANMHMPLQSILPTLPPLEATTIRKQVINTPLEDLTSQKVGAGAGSRIADEIRTELERLVRCIASEKRDELVPQRPIELLEVIGSAYMDRVQKDCIVLQNGELLRPSQFSTVREQQDASDIFKAVGFVMCDAAWRSLVLIAARTVLCRPIGEPRPTALFETKAASEQHADPPEKVSFLPRMILDLRGVVRRAGVNNSKVGAVIASATAGGYFDEQPWLGEAEDSESIDVRRVAGKLDTFSGQRSWRVRNESVAAFVNQLPASLRNPMLRILGDEVIYFDREEIRRALLKMILQLGPCDVAALSPNSGVHTRAILEHETKGNKAYSEIRFRHEIGAAIDGPASEPLILVDDNVSSGTQARAQLYSWTGVPRKDWPTECQNEDGIFENPLSKDYLEKVRRRPIFIFVCAGRDEANTRISATGKELGFSQFKEVKYHHKIQGFKWPPELRDYLRDVGISLMAWANFRKSADQLLPAERKYCEERAFGYDNVGGLVVTESNVPTATVTALWSPGMHRGNPWIPLLIRENKLRHLVVA